MQACVGKQPFPQVLHAALRQLSISLVFWLSTHYCAAFALLSIAFVTANFFAVARANSLDEPRGAGLAGPFGLRGRIYGGWGIGLAVNTLCHFLQFLRSYHISILIAFFFPQ